MSKEGCFQAQLKMSISLFGSCCLTVLQAECLINRCQALHANKVQRLEASALWSAHNIECLLSTQSSAIEDTVGAMQKIKLGRS